MQQSSTFQIGDKVIVPAAISGFGKDMQAIVCKVENFMGNTLVTVDYLTPDPMGGKGGCFHDFQIEAATDVEIRKDDKASK